MGEVGVVGGVGDIGFVAGDSIGFAGKGTVGGVREVGFVGEEDWGAFCSAAGGVGAGWGVEGAGEPAVGLAGVEPKGIPITRL